MRLIPTITIIAAVTAAASLAQAQVRQERNMSLALAIEAASAAVAECHAKGFAVTVTVVDRAGQVKTVQRADGAGPHTVESSQRKAWSSSSFGANTSTMTENAQKNPAASNLWHIPGVMLLAGGAPIKVGNETIGGIGVGGAPSGAIDEECANAGIKKISSQLK